MWQYNDSQELRHYGVVGMKWGKRRAASKYKKEATKANNSLKKKIPQMTINAYNKTASEYNNGKIEAYDKKHKPDSEGYAEGYQKAFAKDFNKNYSKIYLNELLNDRHYQKSQEICKKYGLSKTDDLVKNNETFIKQLKESAR